MNSAITSRPTARTPNRSIWRGCRGVIISAARFLASGRRKFSATYLEIEEHFGGFNFGGGNGPARSRCDGIRLGLRLSFLFTAHSQNKHDGTAKATEHRASPLVVGVGNAST
jgi:hypothetical protein